MNNDPRGSQWRKWDLHIHTPLSIKQNYGGDQEDVWEEFFEELENLPDEYSVLGINDYLFLDGYERVVEYKESGGLENIDLILPVLEFRVDRFAGTSSNLRRVNYHVIFSNQISTEKIKQQFISGLVTNYKLNPKYKDIDDEWSAVVTRDAIKDLGSMIINSSPDEEKSEYGSPLHVGFSNINFKIDDVIEQLDNNSYLKNNYVSAIGKAEWEQMRWEGTGVGRKKDLINKADLVFTAAGNVGRYQTSRQKLKSAEVNHRLLDCSDAHYFSDTDQLNRIGNCNTWIKADPTFEGLKFAIVEFEDRVEIDDTPEKLRTVKDEPSKYIDTVSIRKRDGTPIEEKWFNAKIPLNNGLVSIIGEKGSGKSALVDIIALLGNSQADSFSFLNEEKFRHRDKGKADGFEASLLWHSGTELGPKKLDEDVGGHQDERVKYIGQEFFDKVCDEIKIREGGLFDQEVKSIVFSHIPEEERLGENSFENLIGKKTESIVSSISDKRESLRKLNNKISDLEIKTDSRNIEELENKLDRKREELESHKEDKPPEDEKPPKPEGDSEIAQQVEELRDELEELESKKEDKEERLSTLNKRQAALETIAGEIDNLVGRVESEKEDLSSTVDKYQLDLNIDDLITFEVNKDIISRIEDDIQQEQSNIEEDLDKDRDDSLISKIDNKQEILDKKSDELTRKEKEYKEFEDKMSDWESRKEKIIGDEDIHGSIEYLESRIKYLKEDAKEKLNELRTERDKISKKIHSKIQEVVDEYENVSRYAQKEIDENPLTREKYDLSFSIRIAEVNFASSFLHDIDQSAKGTFYGKEPGRDRVNNLISDTSFSDEEETINFARTIESMLKCDKRSDENGSDISIDDQLVKGVSREEIYNYVYGLDYLLPEFSMSLDGKDIRHLSPGEKGTLLLILYLLVDNDSRPLIIDQPGSNLDNRAVAEFLVPGIKEAKKSRQIFIVTHNPNLAVVCDSEQIIEADIDKDDLNNVTYKSGALEHPLFNEAALNILEGKEEAFSKRKDKYISL